MTTGLGVPRTVQWPPRVQNVIALGHIHDACGNHFPRDIARSSVLSNGQVLVQFGDTFCHNFQREFLGLSNNNCALVPNRAAPTTTAYLTQCAPGSQVTGFDGQGRVNDLIEKRLDEQDNDIFRWKIWSFSGIVESGKRGEAGELLGWTVFEMRRDDLRNNLMDVFQYTGIAEVYTSERQIFARTSYGNDGRRELFTMNEPRFGAFCLLADQEWLYAYGHIGDHRPSNEKDVVLARVPLAHADDRRQYTYWTGNHFSTHFQTLSPVLTDMQHGQIFHTTMFGVNSGYRFAFMGNNARGDSKVQMGRAREPWGPWEVCELDVELYALNGREDKGIFDFRYCVYPHPWAGNMGRGDLMIGWSEGGMTGGVLAAMVRLATND